MVILGASAPHTSSIEQNLNALLINIFGVNSTSLLLLLLLLLSADQQNLIKVVTIILLIKWNVKNTAVRSKL